MLSWQELERQRQAGILTPQAAPLDAQFGIQPFGLEPAADAFLKGGTGTMPGDPYAQPTPQLSGGNGYGHRMQFQQMKRQKERGSMGIAQPHQAESATGDMPIGKKNNMGRALMSLFR